MARRKKTVSQDVFVEGMRTLEEAQVAEPRDAYNCTHCEGYGLVDNNTALCPTCDGTGKV